MFSGSINSEDWLAGGGAGIGGGISMCSKLHLQPLDFTNSI